MYASVKVNVKVNVSVSVNVNYVLYVTLYVCTYVRTYVKIGNYLSGWLVEPSISKVPKLAQAIPAAEQPLHSLQKKHFSFQSCNGWW